MQYPLVTLAMDLDVPVRSSTVTMGLVHSFQLGLDEGKWKECDLIGGPATERRECISRFG